MSQIIDLGNVKYNEDALETVPPSFEGISSVEGEKQTLYESLQILKEAYPKKILFSIKEVAEIINVSYEFIRSAILMGKIKVVKIASRKMINIIELNKIITNGVS